MPTLREIQAAVARSLLTGEPIAADLVVADGIADDDRLRIYRNTFIGTLQGALRLTFPAVERLVGAEFFDGAAAAFIERHPPRSACLGAYGGAFGDFLAGFAPAAPLPYLGDVARLEWAANCAACAPDAPALDPAALAGLAVGEEAGLRLVAHPSLRLLDILYPADRIWHAVLEQDDEALAAIDPAPAPCCVLVHRGAEGIVVRRLTAAEGRFTVALCAGRSLAEAMASNASPAPAGLLAEHLAMGRFTGIARAAGAALRIKEPLQ